MIKMRRVQRTFGDGLIEDEVKGLSEQWIINIGCGMAQAAAER